MTLEHHKWTGFQYSKKIEWIAVFLLLLGGIFIRAFHFGIVPTGVHPDEAMAAVDALALANHGTDRFGMYLPVHFTAWGFGQMSVLLSYCMVPFIKLFGFSIVTIRLPLLITSCLGLLALYWLARKIGGAELAFPTLILCIICPWHYMQSRWSFDCHMFPHVFLFGICLLAAGIQKRWMLYLSMVFFALCSYCYGIANYTVPLFLLAMAVYLLKTRQIKWREFGLCLLIYFGIALPEFLTMFINIMKWDSIKTPFFTIPFFPESVRSQDILFLNFSWGALRDNLVKTVLLLLGKSLDDSPTSIIPQFENLYPFTTVFFLIGLATLWGRRKKENATPSNIARTAVCLWLGMAIWAGIATIGTALHRIAIIFYPMIIISGMGIAWCIRKWKLLALPIAGIYGAAAIAFAACYYGEYADRTQIFYCGIYIEALNYAEELDSDIYYIAPVSLKSGNIMDEILTMFAHEIDAEYFQGVTNIQGGRQLLPYQERYHFGGITAETLLQNKGKNVVYLVDGQDIGLFSEAYDIRSFYDVYYVIREQAQK